MLGQASPGSSPLASPVVAAFQSRHEALRIPLSSVVDPSDTRPHSVQRLERTCAQLQAILLEQEKAQKALEAQLKEAVTKNHMEIMLAGKVTQGDLQSLFTTLSTELTQLLGQKADYAQVESLLAGRASIATIDSLRAEMNHLRDAIRSGEAIDGVEGSSGAGAAGQSNPFERQAQEMLQMLEKMREAQKEAREAEARRRAKVEAAAKEAAAAGSGSLAAESAAAAAAEEAARNQLALHAQRQLDQKEKKELRDKIHRMELAIQLANVQSQARRGGGGSAAFGSSSSAGGPEDEEARLERLVDLRTAKMARAIEELSIQAAAAEKEGDRLRALLEAKHRAAAGGIDGMRMGGGGLGGLGGMGFNELQRFMSELADLQREFHQSTGQSGQHLLEGTLLPRSAALAAQVQEMRHALRDQQRAQARILTSMSSAQSAVEGSVSDLYGQVVGLRRRLKVYSEEFAADVLDGIERQRQMFDESTRFRQRVDRALEELAALVGYQSTTLGQLSLPLHDQLRAVRTTELEPREEEVEARYQGEYAKLRERYDAIVRARDDEEQQLLLMPPDEEKHAPSFESSRPSTSSSVGLPRPGTSPSRPHGRTSAAEARRRSWAAAIHLAAAAENAPVESASGVPPSSHQLERPHTGEAASSARAAPHRSAGGRRPATAADSASAGDRTSRLSSYTPAADSSFQASIGTGPRWRPNSTQAMERPRTSQTIHRHGAVFSPPALARPDSSFASTGGARRSRPNTSGGGGPRHGAGLGQSLTLEYNDAESSLELLRQRLSIPTVGSTPTRSASGAGAHRPSRADSPPMRSMHLPYSPLHPHPTATPAASTWHDLLKASIHAAPMDTSLTSNVHQPMASLPGDAYASAPTVSHSLTPRAPTLSGGSKSSRISTNVAGIAKR